MDSHSEIMGFVEVSLHKNHPTIWLLFSKICRFKCFESWIDLKLFTYRHISTKTSFAIIDTIMMLYWAPHMLIIQPVTHLVWKVSKNLTLPTTFSEIKVHIQETMSSILIWISKYWQFILQQFTKKLIFYRPWLRTASWDSDSSYF